MRTLPPHFPIPPRPKVSDYTDEHRLLRLTLKKPPVHNVVVWWTRALQGEEGVDSTAFPDRKRSKDAAAQQAVWLQAQQMFRERVAARGGPVEIDVGDGSGDEGKA